MAAEEAFRDPPGVALFPEEEAVIAKAVDKRRREFTTTRDCARTALARLGIPPMPIVPRLRGAPHWPDGVVGSMTHCAGYRACSVAHDRDLLTIGLGAEPHGMLPDGVLVAVSSQEERERLTALAAAVPGTHWDRMLFSAKESVYKAWFPLTQRWLGFEDASVTVDPGDGGPLTVADWLGIWVETRARLRDSTRRAYSGYIRVHLRWQFRGVLLAELSPARVDQEFASLFRGGMSEATARRLFSVLRTRQPGRDWSAGTRAGTCDCRRAVGRMR